MSDLISRQAAMDVIDKIFPVDPMRNDYTQGITCGAALAKTYVGQLPSAQPERTIGKWEKGLFQLIDNAPTAEQWILCSDRLPEANGRYLVRRGLKVCGAGALWNKVYILNYTDLMGLKSERIWWDGNVGKSDFKQFDDVLAWMPLPKPYKEANNRND